MKEPDFSEKGDPYVEGFAKRLCDIAGVERHYIDVKALQDVEFDFRQELHRVVDFDRPFQPEAPLQLVVYDDADPGGADRPQVDRHPVRPPEADRFEDAFSGGHRRFLPRGGFI